MDVEDPDPSTILQHEQETETGFRVKSRYLAPAFSSASRRRSDGAALLGGKASPHDAYEGEALFRPNMSDQHKASRTIPDRVAQCFYSLGLFCSSHSYPVILLAGLVVTLSCFPLFSLPFLGNKPKEFVSQYENYAVPPLAGLEGDWPRWLRGPPVAYIQQVIVKSAVVPWNDELLITDAFRAPLAEVFHVIEVAKAYQRMNNSSTPFSQLCFSVGEVKSRVLKGKIAMLPEYGCLTVSPADFWQQQYDKFQSDPEVLATILNYQSHQKGRSGLSEILLGMSIKDTGLKRFPLKPRPRVVSYAITFVLQSFDARFIDGLRQELTKIYPHNSQLPVTTSSDSPLNDTDRSPKEMEDDLNMIHVYFPTQSSIYELIPLVVTYIAMFIYVYFSVKKIDIITSKLGMAISALATVVASLCMSVGLCSHFGMTFEMNAKAIYPYLVVIIGLENILVLTRSVVSTPKNLDVKIRVAQGLSKEGWGITKNLLTEITILTIGFFTFMPAVQEFCILAIVGLMSDFFLQTFFFATVLSLDIHRQKFSDPSWEVKNIHPPLRTPIHPTDIPGGMQRVKSNPQIKESRNGSLKKSLSGISVVAPLHNTPILVKIPKRLRLIYFWARTRFFQRTFTIFMIGWISVIIYESGIVARFAHEPDIALPFNQNGVALQSNVSQMPLTLLHSANEKYSKPLVFAKRGYQFAQNRSMDGFSDKLLHELYSHNPYVWRRLTPYHWQVLLGVYNVTLTGKYITILPSICISIPVQPKTAVSRRHPFELQHAKQVNWQGLARAFERMEMGDEYDVSPTGAPFGKPLKKGMISEDDDPYIPSSPVELALTVLLAIPSLFFIGYLVVVLYRCICSRNYAEWRSSWTKPSENTNDYYTQVVFEAVPLVLDGHTQDVECIGTDGYSIASVCLNGVLKVWNAGNGENIVTVDRQQYFEQLGADKEDSYCAWLPSDQNSPIGSPIEEPRPGSVQPVSNNLAAEGAHSSYLTTSPSFGSTSTTNIPQSQVIPIPARGAPLGSSSFGTRSSPNLKSGACVQQWNHTHTPPDVPRPYSYLRRHKSNSGSLADSDHLQSFDEGHGAQDLSVESVPNPEVPSVWCLDCQENFVFLGTDCGRLEVWESTTGILKCTYEDGSQAGIVCVKVVGNRIILARLSGSLDFLELETTYDGQSPTVYSTYQRWFSTNSETAEGNRTATFAVGNEGETRCVWLMTQKAHQQPITCLDCEGGRILSGSQDHTLKVFRVEDHLPLYTLHGHYGPITCLFIDKFSPMTSGSGSQDGMLCLWDLHTGMCMYSIQAHDGPVNSITYSASYIISVGGDDKICVWERFQGHLLNTIQLDHSYCSSLVMLTQNLLVTSKQGSLIVWDCRSGQPVRAVRLGHRDGSVFVRQIISCSDAVLCDYGSQLRLVHFPSVISKYD